MSNVIRCRARIAAYYGCLHGYGQTEAEWEAAPWYEDPTYLEGPHEHIGTIVCRYCYDELGCPALEHLDAAIVAARR